MFDDQYTQEDELLDPQGGYDFDEDDINQQLDDLLSGKDDTPQQQQQPNGNDNTEQFRAFLEDQRAQRELDRQRMTLEEKRIEESRHQQNEALRLENLQKESRQRVERFKPQFQDIALDDQTKEAYRQADPYIRSIVEGALRDQWDKHIIPALAHYEYEVETLRSRPQATQALSVEDRVSIARPEVNEIIKEQEFQRFLSEPVEGTGLTRREVMNFAYERGNVNSVVQQLDAYTTRKGGAKPTRSAQPMGAVHSAPTGSRNRVRTRGISELSNAQQAFRSGRITRDKLHAIENLFEDLASKNLVDYNK